MTTRPPDPALNQPQSAWELFWVFNRMGLQGFGGVLTIVQRVLVDQKRWLSQEAFVEAWSVAQILPGPNVANLCISLGSQYFGWRGAVAALSGLLMLPCLLMLSIATAFASIGHEPLVAQALKGMGYTVAGLIAAVAWRMTAALKTNPMGVRVCWALVGLTAVLVGGFKWPLTWTLLGIGGMACMWAAHCLRKKT